MTIALHTSYTQRISLIELAASLFGDNTASSSSRELEKRFLALIRKEDSLISAICFSYSGSVAEYDDLRQDALINIWRGLPSFREDSTSRTWIYRVLNLFSFCFFIYSATTSKGTSTVTSLWRRTVATYSPTSLTGFLMSMILRSML